MPDLSSPAAPDNALNVPGLAEVLLNISPAGVMLLHPVYAADGAAIIDFRWGPLNAAAQHERERVQAVADMLNALRSQAEQENRNVFYRRLTWLGN